MGVNAKLAKARRLVKPVARSETVDVGKYTYTFATLGSVMEAVDEACAAHGWIAPEWYAGLKRDAMPLMATPARALAAASDLPDAEAVIVDVPFPTLGRRDLVEWRLGMAHAAPFVADLASDDRARLVEDALARLPGDAPRLTRSIVVLTWRKPARRALDDG